ncbi:hypothetical protein EDD21DRAFT_135236 [Dissophora ornata]|nr:hypothetical protein EDD21DRAFT_135236 [Dissophora ornata]
MEGGWRLSIMERTAPMILSCAALASTSLSSHPLRTTTLAFLLPSLHSLIRLVHTHHSCLTPLILPQLSPPAPFKYLLSNPRPPAGNKKTFHTLHHLLSCESVLEQHVFGKITRQKDEACTSCAAQLCANQLCFAFASAADKCKGGGGHMQRLACGRYGGLRRSMSSHAVPRARRFVCGKREKAQ